MFLISKNKNRTQTLKAMIRGIDFLALDEVPIFDFQLFDDTWITWANVKPSDNLHTYKDGYVIGKISFDEASSVSPIEHEASVDSVVLHPLLQSIVIKIIENDLSVKPGQHCNIFYSKKSISDFQLLIAKSDGLWPNLMNVAILGTVGYFPGNLTLFTEVSKIPFLETLYFPSCTTERYDIFTPQKHDDKKMIERLVDIVPEYDNSALALSGGLDSRFVLALLLNKNVSPKIYTLRDKETPIVEEVCKKLDLSLEIKLHAPLNEYTYTLVSDGMIYFRGGNFSRMLEPNKSDELLHSGLSAASLIENVFNSAWKKPGKISDIYSNLIKYSLIGFAPKTLNGYKENVFKTDLQEELEISLAFGKDYANFESKKQWASWFFHLHRGLNWNPATMADASFFKYPVYLLGDKVATEYAITSSAYSNFYKERLRILNRQLLPNIDVDYSDGRPFKSLPPIIKDIHKLYYEYPKRYIDRLKTIKSVQITTTSNWFQDVNMKMGTKFDQYYPQPLDKLLQDSTVQRNTKRAAITINNILKFLET